MVLTAPQRSALELAIRDALKRYLLNEARLRQMPGRVWINAPRRGSIYVELSGYPVFGPYAFDALPTALVLDLDNYLSERSRPTGQVAATELPKASSWVDLIAGAKPSRRT
jgi:hypothetical protein